MLWSQFDDIQVTVKITEEPATSPFLLSFLPFSLNRSLSLSLFPSDSLSILVSVNLNLNLYAFIYACIFPSSVSSIFFRFVDYQGRACRVYPTVISEHFQIVKSSLRYL